MTTSSGSARPSAIRAFLRSPTVRAAVSFPFRLGPHDSDWKRRPFAGLAAVNNLSGAGDALVTVALAGSVFVSVSLHAARGRTALGLIATVLPFAVVGPFVGPAIDRLRGGRRFIVFGAAIGRLAACLLMASWIHSLLLFPAAFLSLVCSKTHAVAKASLVPGAVEDADDLVRANSRLAVGGSVVTSLAAALGGLVYKLFGSRALLDLDVLVFAACAGVSLYLLRNIHEAAVVAPEAGAEPADRPALPPPRLARKPLRPHGGWGWRLVDRMRPATRPYIPRSLRLASVAMSGMRATAGFLTALVVFGFRREGAPIIWYGLVGLASVGGNFGGALLAPRLRFRLSERALVGGAAVAIGAGAIAVSFMSGLHRYPAALILAGVVALGASLAKTAFDAIVQRDTHDQDRSRLFARFESIFQLVWVVGALFPTLIPIPLLAGFIMAALIVIATSGVFVVGLARLGGAPPAPRPARPMGYPPAGEAAPFPPGSERQLANE
jgi:MFS family permease